MLYYEIKTHRVGMTYNKPHFFILNKGLNSGKPLFNPCPNSFVVTTRTDEDKNTLFHLSMMLQIGGFYVYYLKGSVIPFITIKDCSNTLKNGLNSIVEVEKHIHNVTIIQKELERLRTTLLKMEQLKKAYVQSCFKNKTTKISA